VIGECLDLTQIRVARNWVKFHNVEFNNSYLSGRIILIVMSLDVERAWGKNYRYKYSRKRLLGRS
jgi:hypothetical protein